MPVSRPVLLPARREDGRCDARGGDTRGLLTGGAAKCPIAEKLQAAGTADDVVAVVLLEPMRDLIEQARAGIPPQAMATPAVAELDRPARAAQVRHALGEPIGRHAGQAGPGVYERRVGPEGQRHAQEGPRCRQTAGRSGRDYGQDIVRHASPAAKDAMDVALRLLDGIKLAPAGDQVVVTVAKPKGLENLVATRAANARPGPRREPRTQRSAPCG